MDLELADRVFLITGGTDGLGLSLARKLVDERALVAVCGRDRDRLERAQRHLGDDALCVRVDVTEPDGVEKFVERTIEQFHRLDGVVNNAGRSAASAVANSFDDQWREDYELKVVAALRTVRRSLDALASSRGAVLNVLSVTARAPGANTTPTSASRAAGLALTKSMAAELGPLGVRANAVLVGLIESGQWERRAHDAGVPRGTFYRQLADDARIPLGRVGRAEEFADLASFLLSPRASYVTGVGISLDGGLSPVI